MTGGFRLSCSGHGITTTFYQKSRNDWGFRVTVVRLLMLSYCFLFVLVNETIYRASLRCIRKDGFNKKSSNTYSIVNLQKNVVGEFVV